MSEQFSPEAIFTIYRLRWQIEIVFKTWKSILKIHKIHSAKTNRLYCEIYGKLIMAVIIHRFHNYLTTTQQKVLSLYKIFQYLQTSSIKWTFNILAGRMEHRSFLANIAKQIGRFCQKTKQKNKPIIEDLLCSLSMGHALA